MKLNLTSIFAILAAGLGWVLTIIIPSYKRKVERLKGENKIYQNNINDLTDHVTRVKEIDSLTRSELADFVRNQGKDNN